MINVLVTGGNGQLGECIKNLEPQFSGFNFTFTDYIELDITNSEEVQSFFNNQPLDYCINCAAYTAVDKAEIDVQKAFEINTIGAKHLAQICDKNNTVLIHVSTDFVFDGKKSEAYKETDKANPISVYGNSKLKGEQEIIESLKEHFIIRTSWLFSEYGTNFMKTMIRLSKERDELNVVSDQIGTPTYAKDLAKVILEVINTKSNQYGTYHYSNEGIANWYDFAKAIFKLSKIEIKVHPIQTKDYPTPAERPKYSVLDKTKIKQTLNIKIPHWKDSLKTSLSNL